jgi:hypothetical protein
LRKQILTRSKKHLIEIDLSENPQLITSYHHQKLQVHKNEDVYLYLWRAHNVVNARLKGRETEDPKFPKLPFPAPFLCKDCHVGETNENINRLVEDYLVGPYLLSSGNRLL